MLVGRTAEAASLTLQWDPATDGITAGYVIGYGTQSGNYTQVVDVGSRTLFTVSGLADGMRYYFSIQAYSSTGALSGRSAEASGATTVATALPPGGNTPPTISGIGDQTVPKTTNSVGPLAFTVGDTETSATALIATATSSNTSLVPQSAITLSGTGSARYITVGLPSLTPGSASITVSVTDGLATTSTGFTVTVTNVSNRSSRPKPKNFAANTDGQTIDLQWSPGSSTALVASQISDLTGSELWQRAEAPDSSDPSLRGYRIEFGDAPGSSSVGSFSTGVTTRFTLRDVPAGQYYSRVRGIHSDGETEPSNEVTFTVRGSSGTGAPRELNASLIGRVAHFQWQPPADGTPDGYIFEAGSASGQSNLGILPIGTTSFISPELPDGVYYVRVKAVGGGTPSTASNEVMFSVGASSQPCSGPPGTPVLRGSAAGSVIQLAWEPGAGADATSYMLEAGSAPGRRDLGTLPFDSSTTSLTAPVPNGSYVIRVIAINACGASTASQEVSITVGGAAPALPGVPGNLVQDVSGSRVSFSWAPPVSGGEPTSYVIEATDSEGNPLATFDTGNVATSFTHDTVGAGVYVVRVRAANAAGVGPATEPTTIVVQ